MNTLNKVVYHTLASLLAHLPNLGKKKHDVIIIRTDGIGDFAMWASAVSTIREHYLNKRITYICPSNYSSLVRALHIFDDVITIDKNLLETSAKYVALQLLKLKFIKADVVINPVRARLYPMDYMVRSIKSKEKVGIVSYKKKNFQRDRYYTHLINIDSNLHEMTSHEIFMRSFIDAGYTHRLADFRILSNNHLIGRDYCVIALSSADERKNFEVEKISEVIKSIPVNYAIVLTGYGKTDESRADYLLSHNTTNKTILNYVSKTSILDVVKIVADAKFVLGNDSSTVHLAACTRTPSICYMSGATYGIFLPYPESVNEHYYHPRTVVKEMDCFGCWYNCIKHKNDVGPSFCLKEVSSSMVITELNKLLSEIILNR